MATTTTNFGWDIPQSTDLVKDGATAIAALGQDIDTALLDLKGGTTNQILAKNSNTDLDYKWINNESQILLSTTTLSGATTAISSISQDYKDLLIYVYGVQLSTSANLRLKFPGSDVGFAGSNQVLSYYRDAGPATGATNGAGHNAADGLNLTLQQTSGIGTDNRWIITLQNYTKAFGTPTFNFNGEYVGSDTYGYRFHGAGTVASSTSQNIDSLTFVTSAGTFSAGTVKIYGVK